MSSKGLKVLTLTYNIAQTQAKGSRTLSEWWPTTDHGVPDIVAIGLQEIAPLWWAFLGMAGHVLTAYEQAVKTVLKGQGATYKTLVKSAVGGNGLIVLVKDGVTAENVKSVKLGGASCGVFYLMSNKGAVGARIAFEGGEGEAPSITFVTGHLTAHEPNVAKRNHDWRDIVGRLTFADGSKAKQIYDTSCLFVLGDLNYRIDPKTPRSLSAHVIVHKIHSDPSSLLAHDQLIREQTAGRTLHGLNEGEISFKPTYKTLKGAVDGYKTKRIPSWCDRILYATWDEEGTRLRRYSSHPKAIAADHKPVSAVFRLPPFEGKSLRIESKAPFPVDPLRHQKALIGFLIDRLVGAVWLAIAALGLGNDKLGLVTALALIGATMYWNVKWT